MVDISKAWDLFGVDIAPGLDGDINDLIAKEHQASLAIQGLISGELDIDTFGDILEYSEIDMDDYLLNIDSKIDA